jgi:hypothetical protein
VSANEFISVLTNATAELLAALDHWAGRVDTVTLSSLASSLEERTASLRKSGKTNIPPEVATEIWQILDGIDAAADQSGDAGLAQQARIATTGVRTFYFTRGLEYSTQGIGIRGHE